MDLVLNIVAKIRAIHPDLPLHVFGLGQPHIVKEVFEAGADSIDSSAYVKLAAEGRTWGEKRIHNKVITPTQRMHIALCNLANATQKSIPLSVSSHYQMDL
jgi:helicase